MFFHLFYNAQTGTTMRHSKNKLFRNKARYRRNLFIAKLSLIKPAATHGIEKCLSDFNVDSNYHFQRCCYAAVPEIECLWCNFHERCFRYECSIDCLMSRTRENKCGRRVAVSPCWIADNVHCSLAIFVRSISSNHCHRNDWHLHLWRHTFKGLPRLRARPTIAVTKLEDNEIEVSHFLGDSCIINSISKLSK